jgi:monothiol glutaredoxin
MKALKYTIKDLQNRYNLLKTQKFSLFTLNKINRKLPINQNLITINKSNFSENPSKNDNDDVHSDFKPKSKVEITDDNVMQMIDYWIKNNEVVVFMKGTREMPRCGFSNYSVQILKFYNIKNFKVINILEDPIVREAVKKYSNWPTYPQLYVKGNLIGN